MIRRALLLLMVSAGRAVAQASLPPGITLTDQTAIRSVITRQLDAFKRDDAAAAYQFAAPNVRDVFPSADVFLQMVRRGYQPVYRSRDAEFSELARRDGDLVQEVELIGPDGKPVLAVYTMVPDGKGSWLISACVLMPSVRLST